MDEGVLDTMGDLPMEVALMEAGILTIGGVLVKVVMVTTGGVLGVCVMCKGAEEC